MRSFASSLVLLACCLAAATGVVRAQTSAEGLLKEAKSRETQLRRDIDSRKAGAAATPLLQRARTLVQTYEDISKLFSSSAAADDALWQGATLAADAFWEFGQPDERASALKLYRALESRYPSSPLVKQVPAQTARLLAAAHEPPTPPAAQLSSRPVPPPRPVEIAAPSTPAALLKSIRREVLPDALRVTLELEHEASFSDERVDGPPRVVVDLDNTKAVAGLEGAALVYADEAVRQIRVSRQPNQRTRIVFDLTGTPRYSVYALYGPYRLVVDFERTKDTTSPTTKDTKATKEPKPVQGTAVPSVAAAAPPPVLPPPAPPVANGDGSFSLSRQLGLGVSRIVIDPGHGGHDPGAQVKGLSEASLTLDIALRLEKLLKKQKGVEVLLTRRTNTYVALEERTAIANRAGADLFLSIHANASPDANARGVETYFLNFASNSRSEAVAARENAASGRAMRELTDIVKAIALNNKIDESRDFAASVQSSMYGKLRRSNKSARNLGVKPAPFVVLIGATMPSVLAEVSFLTNTAEAALLKTSRYRDQVADALLAGVLNYQKSLKSVGTVATR